MKTLIIYSSMYGCTKECSEEIQKRLGGETDIVSVKEASKLDISSYSHVVIGSSIAAGNINSQIKKWMKKYHELLITKKVNLFICSGEADENYFTKNFNEDLLAKANQKAFFGGRLRVDDMKGFVKFMMKAMGKAADFDSLDKEKIESFSNQIISN